MRLNAPHVAPPPQERANVVWALARLGHHPGHARLASAASAALLDLQHPKGEPPTAQALSSMMWAFATLRFHPGDAWLEAAVDAIVSAGAAAPQAAANAAWALATLRACVDATALDALAAAAAPRLQSFSPQARRWPRAAHFEPRTTRPHAPPGAAPLPALAPVHSRLRSARLPGPSALRALRDPHIPWQQPPTQTLHLSLYHRSGDSSARRAAVPRCSVRLADWPRPARVSARPNRRGA